jgi:hypothetical protein
LRRAKLVENDKVAGSVLNHIHWRGADLRGGNNNKQESDKGGGHGFGGY